MQTKKTTMTPNQDEKTSPTMPRPMTPPTLSTVLAIVTLCLAGTCASAATPDPAEALRRDLGDILRAADLGATVTAVRVLALPQAGDPAPAEVLFSVRAGQPMIPASTMKLVSTAASLDRFGIQAAIRTPVGRFAVAGKKDAWDLAVIGQGDPNFSGRFYGGDTVGAFRRWAAVLKSRGVTAVERVLVDDSLFDAVLQHPNWPADQRDKWYEAPVAALALNDNCVDIHVSPTQPGSPARVRLEPPGDYATIDGRIMTVADRKNHRFGLERVICPPPGPAMRICVSGGYWARAAEAVENRTVADPVRFFGEALAHTLRAEGVAVAGPVLRAALVGPDGRAIAGFVCDLVHASPLAATCAVANKNSQGLYAECLLKRLGAFGPTPATDVLVPRQGNWANGTQEALRWMAERGIATDGVVIDDGSGLSKENRLTAAAVTDLLAVAHARLGDAFVETLAVAGRDGSLAGRMRGTAAAGRVFGKTGYVLGASTLSGYVRTASGRTLAYSVLMNDVPWGELWKARQAQDRVCVRLVEY
jgi:D-alanyl-D-alanine carboxypeptidase/D-alanyl-D-alanine-endopeptidase (penicillin-binding protein 4)